MVEVFALPLDGADRGPQSRHSFPDDARRAPLQDPLCPWGKGEGAPPEMGSPAGSARRENDQRENEKLTPNRGEQLRLLLR